MNLNEITANIRLRNPWEAIDLGLSMTQHWWKQLYFPLIIVTVTIAVLLYLVTPQDSFWIASLIFWLLKPLYDRVILHVVSRKLFNQSLTTWQVIKKLPWLIWNTGFFQSVSFRRLAFSRGYSLPIWQLEQLRGDKRVTRQKVLFQSSHTQAIWLTISLMLLETIFYFSLIMVFYFFLPEEAAVNFVSLYFDTAAADKAFWIEVVNYALYVIVIIIVHPFYIASSFALYVNRRTQLEAWDIELDFRNIAKRLTEHEESLHNGSTLPQVNSRKTTQGSTLSVFILAFIVSLFTVGTPSAKADQQSEIELFKQHSEKEELFEQLTPQRQRPERAKALAKETMRLKELNDKKIVKYWVLKEDKEKKKTKKNHHNDFDDLFKTISKVMGFIIEFGLWLLLGIGVALLIFYRKYLLSLFNVSHKHDDEDYQAPDIMFGMNVRPESLPEDIIAMFTQYWQNTQHREALSLLYRAALIELINTDEVKLLNSHTENDVLKHAKAILNKKKVTYLTSLTSAWKEIAYAHRVPQAAIINHLVDHWHSDFMHSSRQSTHEESTSS